MTPFETKPPALRFPIHVNFFEKERESGSKSRRNNGGGGGGLGEWKNRLL